LGETPVGMKILGLFLLVVAPLPAQLDCGLCAIRVESAAGGKPPTVYFGTVERDAKFSYESAVVLSAVGGLLAWHDKSIKPEDEVAYLSSLLRELKKDRIVVIFDRDTKLGEASSVLERLRRTPVKVIAFHLQR
jgi:hypothetical protein